jgi:hypothetical protein
MVPAPPRRKALNDLFKALLGNDNVYFQPPDNVTMAYPCIVYERDDVDIKSADNRPYTVTKRYQVTLIDPNPDSDVVDKLLDLPQSEYQRHFATSNLNHDVFVLYY